MKKTRFVIYLCLAVTAFLGSSQYECHGGLFQLDFAVNTGEAEGWDVIDPIAATETCDFDGVPSTGVEPGGPVDCTTFPLTDQLGQDNDVILEVLGIPFTGNTTPFLEGEQLFDGVAIPPEALGDYHYRTPDTAGSSAPMRLRNLAPGEYRVTVFEGRTTDGNGQFAKVWAGDANGSDEPGVPGDHEGKNTGDFAAGSATVELTVGQGQNLWYRHLEDNSGGISGIIVRLLRGIDVLPGDFNDDGVVDASDFQIMSGNFNSPGAFEDGDMNFNGQIDLRDFLEFRTVFGSQAGQAAAVPEPASALLGLLAGCALMAVRRRR